MTDRTSPADLEEDRLNRLEREARRRPSTRADGTCLASRLDGTRCGAPAERLNRCSDHPIRGL